MEDYFSSYNVQKHYPGPSLPPPSRVHSCPTSYDPPKAQTEGHGEWARYFGSYSNSLGYAQDMEELCLRTGATARKRRGREEMVQKFSALTLDDDDQEQSRDNRSYDKGCDTSSFRMEPSRFQHHNIFQSKIMTQGSTICFAQAQKSEVIRRVKMVDMGESDDQRSAVLKKRPVRSCMSYLAVVFWILGIFTLIFILKEQEVSQGPLWSGSGMLTMTMSANVSEWDGIWRASFTIRSDNSLILYILLIGAIVGLLRQIFD